MTLPILVSVPHAGLRVPAELASACLLTPAQIAEDGDEHAAAIYDIASEVEHYVTTDIARAVVDLNRAEDDRRPDGVVKTHTCFNVPVWREPLGAPAVEWLLARHHRPYHARLGVLAGQDVRLAVDCHTMLAVGPPMQSMFRARRFFGGAVPEARDRTPAARGATSLVSWRQTWAFASSRSRSPSVFRHL